MTEYIIKRESLKDNWKCPKCDGILERWNLQLFRFHCKDCDDFFM